MNAALMPKVILLLNQKRPLRLKLAGSCFTKPLSVTANDAVDTAIRKALIRAYPVSQASRCLTMVRILAGMNDDANSGGTDAMTRVLIECRDDQGQAWTSVGVSTNIIDASGRALAVFRHGVKHCLKMVSPHRRRKIRAMPLQGDDNFRLILISCQRWCWLIRKLCLSGVSVTHEKLRSLLKFILLIHVMGGRTGRRYGRWRR